MNFPTQTAAYMALFVGVGVLFLGFSLGIGILLRPKSPNTEKLEVYECGEPTIGSSFVQFDLRFYVVALLFIIFDVEVAFFFPWGVVFGKATQLMNPHLSQPAVAEVGSSGLTVEETGLLWELGVHNATSPTIAEPSYDATRAAVRSTGRSMALMAIADIGAFFFVLMVGFAYVWCRGDLDWVRAMSKERALQTERAVLIGEDEPALSA